MKIVPPVKVHDSTHNPGKTFYLVDKTGLTVAMAWDQKVAHVIADALTKDASK